MTKKKRHHPDVEELLARPWCYYCERDFDDLKILINHQKAKHFKCERCGRRLNTAGGLSVHMSQVHKENLTAVDNALPNRAGLDIEIFGMEGIPEDIVQQHNQRVLTAYHQTQAERQAAGAKPASGGQGPNAPKKPKLESVSDIKKRLAEHKAAKMAAEEQGGSSRGDTPNPPASGQSQTPTASAASPVYSGYQQTYGAPPTNGSYGQPAFTQAPAPVTAPYQAPTAYPPAGSPPLGAYAQTPTPQPGQPAYGQVPPVAYPPQPYAPYQQQPPPMGYPAQPSFSPPPYQPAYPGQSYPGPAGIPPRPFGAVSPVPGFPQQSPPMHLAHRALSPTTNGSFPPPVRTGSVSLPSAPGLPQRPAFGAPPVNASQFQRMHQGQLPATQAHNSVPQGRPHEAMPSTSAQHPSPANVAPPASADDAQNASSLDDLIASASKEADAKAAAPAAPAAAPDTAAASTVPSQPDTQPSASGAAKEPAAEEKAEKKDKEKPKTTRLVYSDNETSPEEKMAMMPKYAFTPAQKTIMV
ncbi:hypothetical protein HRR83_008053 [Exophiala dermatitidis]|uniref:C2H2-type domain-containing protein n=2 Tax=Exophiala dermatitidis TaxID=5970 RepID=H6BTG8_EXODN|nr:uncharacterized protein HMPREF1120_02535 [Exophiala dermatitidis NIH/UT8656]KAJ4503304.1 hypothetical protein HRR75_008087 [Exophiala dermatitidis]EHY54365.1 hypothetical protein HMPREF1120_02535 [Exophiala dermatitidis NIH/UT8656]KAJ4504975.1 hypothetical protein HRR74_008803 [Exophiala dermatitidis]KAJ4513483.1 hypothetical protein HRR73_005641 [Exophiala dermatitidis]KAJ4535742.1 hypothetical protein HRR77_007688 [Exophiala dermatitidis]